MSIVYIPFTSSLENLLSPKPKRCNKMYRHDSSLLSCNVAIQTHNEDHTDKSQNKTP